METSRITRDTKHAGCGGILVMAEDAPLYIIEHEALETPAARGGIQPILCINKLDLSTDTSAFVGYDVPIVRCSRRQARESTSFATGSLTASLFSPATAEW